MSYFQHYVFVLWTLGHFKVLHYGSLQPCLEILDKAKFAGENKFYNINAKHFIYLFFLILWK